MREDDPVGPMLDQDAIEALDLTETAGLVLAAARLITTLEDETASAKQQAEAFKRAHVELKPLVVTPGTEPRPLIIAAFRCLGRRVGRLQNAVGMLSSRSRAELPPDVFTTLLELFVEAKIYGLDEVAFRSVETFQASLQEPARGARLQTALVELAGVSGGPPALFSMTGRINTTGHLDRGAAFAAVRLICSQQPQQLKLALDIILRMVKPERLTAAAFRPFLSDLTHRAASPLPVLIALTELDPRTFPGLFEAAFDGKANLRPPCEIIDEVSSENVRFFLPQARALRGEQVRFVEDDMQSIEIDVVGTIQFEWSDVCLKFDDLMPRSYQFRWLWRLRRAVNVRARQRVLRGAGQEMSRADQFLNVMARPRPPAGFARQPEPAS